MSNFQSEVYSFSHLSQDEFENTKCGSVMPDEEEKLVLPLTRNDGVEVFDDLDESAEYRRKRSTARLPPWCLNQNFPNYKNWHEEGKTSKVQDQGRCGCCYVFSSLAVLESRVAIQYNSSILKYSAQHTIECVKNFTMSRGRDACKGGRPEYIWIESKEKAGVVPESSYISYNQVQDSACFQINTKDARAEVDYYYSIFSENEDEMLCHVALNGPIHVSIDSSGSFASYSSGIWDDPKKNCTNPRFYNHAVTVVGRF